MKPQRQHRPTQQEAEVRMCYGKKPLSEKYANRIIGRAASDGTTLYKYWCPVCMNYHITKIPRKD